MEARLVDYKRGEFRFQLEKRDTFPHPTNRYTVIIGPNGCGKSRLLGSIADAFLKQERLRQRGTQSGPKARLQDLQIPATRLLAISNMVMDNFSFPLSQIGNYHYLGLRAETRNSVSTGSLRQRALESFLKCYVDKAKMQMLKPTLHRLAFDTADVVVDTKRSNPRVSTENDGALSRLRKLLHDRGRATFESEHFPTERELAAVNSRLVNFRQAIEEGTILNSGDLAEMSDIAATLQVEIPHIARLLHLSYGLTLDISFEGLRRRALLSELSTGQLLLLSTFSRLIATVTPGSVVLIDEPEAGLHPAWQAEYIPLIRASIPDEMGCHFFIATHSPHLVADGTDLLVPGKKWGTFKEFTEPFFGRSTDNLLFRAFESPTTGNTLVNHDLTLLMEYMAGISRESKEKIEGVMHRLDRIAGPDTVELNSILDEARDRLGIAK